MNGTRVDDRAEATTIHKLSLRPTNELVVEAQDGNVVAFEELFRRYYPRLFNFLESQLTNCAIDADDVVQEAFTRAWTNLRQFDQRYQFTTWLYTIAVRTGRDHRRRIRHETQTHSVVQRVCPNASPSAEQQRRETAQSIWSTAKRVLSADQFSATWLRYGEDLPVAQVASILGKTSVGTRVLLHRSRSVLQNHLREFSPVRPGSTVASEQKGESK